MFPAWRIELGAARRALYDGRWEEAAAMLSSERLREFLPAKRLSKQLADKLVARAAERLGGSSESSAGWRDLRHAAQLAPVEAAVDALRRREAQRRVASAYALLASGAVGEAIAVLERMEGRNLGGDERRQCQAIARRILDAEAAAREGMFATAAEATSKGAEMVPPSETALAQALSRRVAGYRQQHIECERTAAELHAALVQQEWSTVLSLAAKILEIAPRHAAARRARRKAWQAVGMDVTQAYVPAADSPLGDVRRPVAGRLALRSTTHPGAKGALVDTAIGDAGRGGRFVAWIDGVGGYLVCLGQEVVLGQPSPTHEVDIPVLADLSRRHAVIRRDGESYVLTPIHTTAVNGQPLAGPTVLKHNDRIRLGAALELTFRRPHALSATAVLERASNHKFVPAVDGVVLMSDTCVMGPRSHCHVACRPWEHDVVLFRRGNELAFRAAGPFEIDGRTFLAEAPLAWGVRIEGDDFALSFEELK